MKYIIIWNNETTYFFYIAQREVAEINGKDATPTPSANRENDIGMNSDVPQHPDERMAEK